MLAAGAALALAGIVPARADAGRSTTPLQLLQAVNAARRAHGLGTLQVDARLQRAARSHSLDMLRRGYFAHGDFPGRMTAFQVRGPVEGENLAWGNGPYGRAGAMVREWLASPEHRANLLRPGFSRIGIGLVRGMFLGNAGATVATVDFAGD